MQRVSGRFRGGQWAASGGSRAQWVAVAAFELGAGLWGLLPLRAEAGPFQFTDVTEAAGILHTHSHPPNEHPYGFTDNASMMSGGAVAEDFDGDGRIDLYVLQGGASANLMYMNRGGGVFIDEAVLRGADLLHYGMGAAAADYDNDGDIDIAVTVRDGPPVLLVNNGEGFFRTVTLEQVPKGWRKAMSPAWGDIDNDGQLELAVAQWEYRIQGLHLYRAQGERLVLMSEYQTVPYTNNLVFTPRFADFNQDRRVDLPLAGDFRQSQLHLNLGGGMFARVTSSVNAGADENGMGAAVGDYDNDGDLDWFVSSIGVTNAVSTEWKLGNRLYRNRGNGVFDDVSEEAGVWYGGWGWGSVFGDLDNDGDLDLYHVNGWPAYPQPDPPEQFISDPARLFENLGDGTFREVAAGTGADHRGQGRGVLLFDYDDDGDLDIFICNNMEAVQTPAGVTYEPGIPALLRNDSPTTNHWLKITLEGSPPLHRHGIGSRVYVSAAGTEQMRELDASTGFLSQGPGRIAHFGLGGNAVADEVRAEWNSGDAVARFGVAANQTLSLPSPSASLSARTIMPGQPVTATAPTATMPVTWLIQGTPHPNPATVTFDETGIHELILHLYEPDGTTLAGQEILRVTVLETAHASLTRTGAEQQLAIGWEAARGRLYNVQSAPSLDGDEPWTPAAIPFICPASGPHGQGLSHPIGSAGFYRIAVDPLPDWPTPE